MYKAHYLSGVDNYEVQDMLILLFNIFNWSTYRFFEGCESDLTKFQSNFLLLHEFLSVSNYRYFLLRLLFFLGMVALTIFSKRVFHLLIKSKACKSSFCNLVSGGTCSKSSSNICPICELARNLLSLLDPY